MEKEKFERNLKAAGQATLELFRRRVINQLSDNLIYRIQPDRNIIRADLSAWEKQLKERRLLEINRLLTFDEAINKLWFEGLVPATINISVYRSDKHSTTINLFVDSRNVRNESDMSNDEFEPFCIELEIPVYMSPDDETRFDVNWRHKKLMLKYRMWKRKRELKKKIKNVAWWKEV